jgi:PRC-barrel domain
LRSRALAAYKEFEVTQTPEDLGRPVAFLALDEGVPVYDVDGEQIGVVEGVVGDTQAGIFDGVIVHTRPLPGHHRFADFEQIEGLYERGVLLKVARDELHVPPDEEARRRREKQRHESPLEARLRRAWDWLAGYR